MGTNSVNHFLYLLGKTSLEAGVLVVAVLALSWLFRNQLTPRWRCALWWMVAVRLLLPISLSSPASLFNLLPREAQLNFKAPIPESASGHPATETPLATSKPISFGKPASHESPIEFSQPAYITKAPEFEKYLWSWQMLLFGVWLGGVLVMAGYVAAWSVRLWRRSSPLKGPAEKRVDVVLGECCERLQLRSPPPVLESAMVTGPALHGFFQAQLLLPTGFAEKFSTAELRFVFLHELAHLKRRDLLMNWLAVALQMAHWFNPLVWYGFARWRTERELACDAMALEAAGEGQNREYGRTILRLLDSLGRPKAAPGLVGILEDRHQVRRRIGMIASFVPSKGWPRLAVALIGALAVIGLTDARSNSLPGSNPAPKAISDTTVTSTQQKGPDMSNSIISKQLVRGTITGIVALASAALPVAAHGEENAAPATPVTGSELTGAWVLVGTPDHVGKTPSSGGRIKFFAGTHWCITQADPKTGVVLFHHGGTYSTSGNTLRANLNFANSSTIGMVGKTNGDFTYKVEGDTLTSLGVDNPWKEVWRRLEPRGKMDAPLASSLTGTWAYVGKPGTTNTVPDMNRLKFCAGGYWCDSEIDERTSVVVIHHGGYYSLKDGKYVETCQYANPVTMNLIGEDVKFDIAIEGDTMTLKGIGNPWKEVWKRVD